MVQKSARLGGAENLIKISPTIYDILESTVKAAIQFTEADQGHIFLHKRVGDRLLISHQCLVTREGKIIRQYKEDRAMVHGPCNRALEEGRMYYVHDAKSNALHQRMLEELRRIAEVSEPGSLKKKYLDEYIDFLGLACSYIAVPIKTISGEPIGCIALYSVQAEDYFGAMRKRIIEEYLNNFASSLIIALIDKASAENERMRELLDSYVGRFFLEQEVKLESIFDSRDDSSFQGVGPFLEHILRRSDAAGSWNDVVDEMERFLICFSLIKAEGKIQRAFRLLKMPKRTFYNKVKKLRIDIRRYTDLGVGQGIKRSGKAVPLG